MTKAFVFNYIVGPHILAYKKKSIADVILVALLEFWANFWAKKFVMEGDRERGGFSSAKVLVSFPFFSFQMCSQVCRIPSVFQLVLARGGRYDQNLISRCENFYITITIYITI